MLKAFRRRGLARDGSVQIEIVDFDQALQIIDLALAKLGNMGIGETADNQIHLARAAMPAAITQPLAPIIKPRA